MKTNQSKQDEAEVGGLDKAHVQRTASALRTYKPHVRRTAAALRTYKRAARIDLKNVVSDLLADLMHWCDCHDQDFEDKLRIGRMHYGAEKVE